jgi:hypothetical protein
MTELEIKWPDDMTEQVRVAIGRIVVAGEALRSISLEERLHLVRLVLEDWTRADSPWRRELVTLFSEDSPFHEGTIREGLDAALRAWKPDALVECAMRELAPALHSDSLALSPFAWTAVLAGGGIPMPTLLSGLLPLILGSPVLLREASGDRVTAGLLKRSLEKRSEILAAAFEHISFASEDTAFAELLVAPCVVATGSDETIRSISNRLLPSQRFVAYGHQFSIGILGPHLPESEDSIKRISEAFALDIARWDQLGCLSPVVLYLVGLDPSTNESIANALASALENLQGTMPRGSMSTAVRAGHANEIAEARMREAEGLATLFEGSDSVVVLEANTDPRPAPLHRFIRLMPVASLDRLEEALAPFSGHLSNVATTGFSPDQARDLIEFLSRLGTSRLTNPGRLQTPPIDWPHDGMPLLTPMARFVQPH